MLDDFRKVLLKAVQVLPIADVIRSLNDWTREEFYPKAINPKINRKDPELASDSYLRESLYDMGKDLLTGENFLSSIEYPRREFLNESARILAKSTDEGYLRSLSVFGLSTYVEYRVQLIDGDATIINLPSTTDIYVGAVVFGIGIPLGATVQAKTSTTITLSLAPTTSISSSLLRIRNEAAFPLIKALTPPDSIYQWDVSSAIDAANAAGSMLDQSPDGYELDQDMDRVLYYDPFGNPVLDTPNIIKPSWYLDSDAFLNLTTRHFIIEYYFESVEIQDVFLTADTQAALLQDVNHHKRLLETPHFEPRLLIEVPIGTLPPNPSNMRIFPGEIDDTITGTMEMVAFTTDFTQATRIQFGTGYRTDLSQGSINSSVSATGLAVAVRFGADFPYFDIPAASGASGPFGSDLFVDINHYSDSYLPPLTVNGASGASGSTTVLVSSTTDLYAGNVPVGPWFNPGTTIQSINSPSLLTLTKPIQADFSNAAVNFLQGVYELTDVYDQANIKYSFPLNYFRIEEQTTNRLILRNYIFPFHKWSHFTELALFDINNLCIFYASFPLIEYHPNMLSSIYLEIKFDTTPLPEDALKYVLPFDIPDWSVVFGPSGPSGASSSGYAITVPYDSINAPSAGFPNPHHKSGYIPFISLFKNNSGVLEDWLEVDEIRTTPSGTVKITVPASPDGRFKGKLILV